MTTTRNLFFFFQAEDGIRDYKVTGVQTCALPILCAPIEYTDSVSLSPFRMSFRKSNFMGASPAYTGVVAGSSVAVTSIQPCALSSLVPGSRGEIGRAHV